MVWRTSEIGCLIYDEYEMEGLISRTDPELPHDRVVEPIVRLLTRIRAVQ